MLNKDLVWLSEFENQKVDLIVSNPPFTPDSEFNSLEFKRSIPQVSSQNEKALRTFDESGTKPYVDIITNSKKLGTNHFLFRINPKYLQIIIESISALNCLTQVVEDKGNKRFLAVTKNA